MIRHTIILVILMTGIVWSQTDDLDRFNQYRNQINKNAMLILGGWALGNIAVSSVYYGKSSGSNRYFFQMNAAWNLVNLGIAGFGYYGSIGSDTLLTINQSLNEQSTIEKILLFNTGLDVAYVMTGFYLRERAKNSVNYFEQFRGYGNSLILQGSFLFIFDLVVYLFQNQNKLLTDKILSCLYLSPGKIGLQFVF